MSRFLGEYSPNITEGSRIALPKKLRKYIRGDEVILAKGFDRCVYVYDKEDWTNLAQKRIESRQDQTHIEALERYLYTSATEAPIDAQGRVVIPGNLQDYAGINKRTAVLGVGDHIEVWDYKTWQEYLEKVSGGLTATA